MILAEIKMLATTKNAKLPVDKVVRAIIKPRHRSECDFIL